ncbi:MAG: Crp/Fnr family transcriptional regulator [Bacteroidetes bacterium]|nr:Crp/Fnr family transcriptional regulator [Bacteroidota bacterium]
MAINYLDSCKLEYYDAVSYDMLSENEKELLDKNTVIIDYKKGETICKQGTFASNVIFIEKGLVKVYIEGNPKNLILTITPENYFVGLQTFYNGNNTYLYSVSTYVDTRARLIDIQTFKQVLNSNARFASRIIQILNENSAQAYGRFFCLTRKQSHGRMADILLCLSYRIFKSNSFELPLSRQDLGELTGLSTESVIRIMKDFKDEKLISVSCKTLEILDPEKLQKISEVG